MYMVGIAQLVERQIVALKVMGSNPITHPIYYLKGLYYSLADKCCENPWIRTVRLEIVASGKYLSTRRDSRLAYLRRANCGANPITHPIYYLKGQLNIYIGV